MIIWNSLKLFPHIHGYLFIFANTEIYVIITFIEKLSRRHLIDSSDVFVIKGFTVYKNTFYYIDQGVGGHEPFQYLN